MATQTTLFTPILGCKKDGYFCNHLIFRAESGTRNSRTLMRPRVGYIYNPPKPSFEKEGFKGRRFSYLHHHKAQEESADCAFLLCLSRTEPRNG